MRTISKIKAAILYAQAMSESAANSKELEVLYNDARKIVALPANDLTELVKLNNPLWSLDNKFEALKAIADRLDLSSNVCNTLKLLAEHKKLDILQLVAQQFILLYQNKHNIAEIDVLTAVALNKKQDLKLKQTLSAIFKKDVLINYIHSPQIIGGLVIKYGTNYIDNSLQHKFNVLEQVMKGKK